MEKVEKDKGEEGEGKKDSYILNLGTGWIVVPATYVKNIGGVGWRDVRKRSSGEAPEGHSGGDKLADLHTTRFWE